MKKISIEKETFISLVDKYKCKTDIARALNISVDTVRRIAIDLNVHIPRVSWRKGKKLPVSYCFVDKNWLSEKWVNSERSLSDLSKEYGIPLSVLENRASAYSLKKPYKYPLDKDKFEQLFDPHIWYLAGLIATDGYIPKGQNSVEIDLTGEDELDLLYKICIYFNMKARPAKYGKSNRLRISYPGLNEFLSKSFNLFDGPKTFSVQPPAIFPSEICAKAYILGCIDGDGYIGDRSKYGFSLTTGSIYLVKGISSIYERYSGIHIPYHDVISDGKTYPCLSATDKKARDFLSWVYSEKEKYFYLPRKFLNYKKMMI